jgi:hypothetical protein
MSIEFIDSSELLYSYPQYINNYDSERDTYEKLFRIAKYTSTIIPDNPTEQNVIIFYDKNDVEICRSKYEVLYVYLHDCKTLIWGWCLLERNSNKHYGTELLRYLIYNAGLLLHNEYITSRLSIKNYMQLDIYDAILSMYTKKPLIYRHYYNSSTNKHIINKKTNLENRLFLLDHANIKEKLNNYKE